MTRKFEVNDCYRPIVTIKKVKKEVPTVIEVSGRRYVHENPDKKQKGKTEMKKDKDWLKTEINKMYRDVVSGARGLNAEMALFEVYELVKELDEPEVLSQKWIDENKVGRINGVRKKTTSDVVTVTKLKNLLVPKQDKPVIPRFVADYIELNKGWSEDRQEYVEDNSSGLWFALNGDSQGIPNSVSDWLFNEEKVETFARAWFGGYEVKKEKLYYIVDKVNNSTLMTFELSDVVGEEIIEFVDGYSKNETIHFDSKEKAELIAHFVGESLEVEEVTE